MVKVANMLFVVFVAASALFVTSAHTTAQTAPALYTLEIIEPLEGDASTSASEIANGGWVAGTSSNAEGNGARAILYRDGVVRDRSNGLELSYGTAVNKSAQLAGYHFVYPERTAAVWDGSEMIDLPSLGSPDSIANGINDDGVVVGASKATEVGEFFACKWMDGEIVPLATPGVRSSASAINKKGEIVGSAETVDRVDLQVATLWIGEELIFLGTLGGANSAALSINDRGQIVGVSLLSGDVALGNEGSHAFLWEAGVMTDLGTFPGGAFSLALDINNDSLIVGQSQNPDPNRDESRGRIAVLWANGEIINLNDRIRDDGGWTLISAVSIDDAGQIAGVASDGERTRGYVLTPVEE